MSAEAQSLILAGAIMSITINPLMFRVADLAEGRSRTPAE